jgi:hypothetical protein
LNSELNVTAEQSLTGLMTVGVAYDGLEWRPVSTSTFSAQAPMPLLSTSMEGVATVYAEPKISFEVFSIAGPYAALRGYGQLTGTVETVGADLQGGLDLSMGFMGTVGGQVDVLGIEKEISYELFDWSTSVWSQHYTTDTEDTELVDTETIDTETTDTEPVDTSTVDTETVDTETIDTETIDTATVDTSTVDTETEDTETIDTETTDTETVDSDTGEDTDTGEVLPADCTGLPDFTPCSVVTTPDRSYDICIRESCQSPGCGTAECNAPGPHFPLPDTNQRLCYNSTTTIDCPAPGEAFYGQDAQYGWDVSHAETERYTRDLAVTGEPVVVDNVTGLLWQGCAAGLSGDNCEIDDEPGVTGASTYTWEEALAYCDSLDWGGYTDWHLPDEFELDTIVDSGRSNPSIEITTFPEAGDDIFWCSSSSVYSASYAWYIAFTSGYSGANDWSNPINVRCGRSGTSTISSRFARSTTSANQPVVTDTVTTLVWQGCAAGQTGDFCAVGTAGTYTWTNALSYCENLSWGGYTDWRLPSIRELRYIVDNSRHSPAIDVVAFSNTLTTRYYWTSSSDSSGVARAWTVMFSAGHSYDWQKIEEHYVRCVRNGS